jgi:hypothetical protein
MSADRDVNRIVRSWLSEDAYEDATRVLDAVLDQLDTIPQRRPVWPARRFPPLNTATRIALAAVAVVVLALVGIRLLMPGTNNTGGPAQTARPSPTPSQLRAGEQLDGRYSLTVWGVANATITVPEGWFAYDSASVNNHALDPSLTAVIFWPSDSEFERVYADPCHWQAGYVDPPVGATVDDLATALANQPQRGDSHPIDVSIDGYRGKMIELSVPSDINFANCDAGEFRSWDGRYQQGPGQIDQLYILDVGGQRLVIDTFYMPGTSEADRAERQAIVNSIQLDRL